MNKFNELYESIMNEGKEIPYNVDNELKYQKMYNKEIEKIAKGGKITDKMRVKAAKKVYDNVIFTNGNVTYKLTVNNNPKSETDVIKIVASAGNQSQTKMTSPANIPFIIG